MLRRWVTDTGWDEDDNARRRTAREAAALQRLAPTAVPAPELVAADPEGRFNDGVPSLVMTRVPGAVNLTPADPAQWLRHMAEVLPVIHAVTVPDDPFKIFFDTDTLAPPAWSRWPDHWRAAIDLIRQDLPEYPPTFIHSDFQHFNVLWSRGRLTGVIDWTDPRNGPPDIDVGHCRLNLAILFSPETAERFRDVYESIAGRMVDPRWDVISLLRYLPGWGSFIQFQAGRRALVDVAGMHGRVDELLRRAMRRL